MRYPGGGDDVDMATHLQNLALDVEDTLQTSFISTEGGVVTGPVTLLYGLGGGIKYGGSGPQILSGIKSPYDSDNELVLQNLAVGSMWIQTDYCPYAVGTGTIAVTWIKKWSSPGYNSEWAILYGDSGVRNVTSSWMNFNIGGAHSLGAYMDNTTPFSTSTIRRVNNTITVEMTAINFTTTRSGWEIVYGYESYSGASYGYSWGLDGNSIYGTAFQEASSTMKPFRVRDDGTYTYLELYAPSSSATYSASVSFPANQAQWPNDDVFGYGEQGYLGADPSSTTDW